MSEWEIYRKNPQNKLTSADYRNIFHQLDLRGEEYATLVDTSRSNLYAYARKFGYKIGTHKRSPFQTEVWVVHSPAIVKSTQEEQPVRTDVYSNGLGVVATRKVYKDGRVEEERPHEGD